jgi:hypothetical protein
MQGVKVRLEVGPKEAQEGGCIFSVSSKPGEVATKAAMQVRCWSGADIGPRTGVPIDQHCCW